MGKGAIEVFLQEASEHLQFLREYSSILQDAQPNPADLERLYIAAHTLCGNAGTYGFPLFSEIAGKLAHVFQYTRNAPLNSDTIAPLTEFLSDAISVLEFDLLEISDCGTEVAADIQAFKQRYAFAFPPVPTVVPAPASPASSEAIDAAPYEATPASSPDLTSHYDLLPADAEVSNEVLQFFVPEAEEHLSTITECLLALETNPNSDDINRLFRSFHTIKGSAAQVGLHRISAISHRVEDLIGQMREGAIIPSPELTDLCLESVDILKKFLHNEWPDEMHARSVVDSFLSRVGECVPEAGTEHVPVLGPEASPAEHESRQNPVQSSQTGTGHKKSASSSPHLHSVRISLERLDKMMNAVGELVINRTRMIGRLAELEKLVEILTFSKSRLAEKISGFQDKYEFNWIGSNPAPAANGGSNRFARPASGMGGNHRDSFSDFTELEMDRYDDFSILSRSLTEISADVNEVLGQLGGFMGRVDADIDEFTKLAHHLQDQITQARMVPIGNLYTRLSRTVRDAAKATGKEVDLILEGADTELDNNIIQQISDPLIHIVRNAVAHGIEGASERQQAGKSPQGRISVRAYHRGNHIFIEVEDDGRGIDLERIRARALEAGFATPDQAQQMSDRDLRNLLFLPGFSTVREKTELAGRGVGLDVVKSSVDALNGEVEVRGEAHHGACFTLRVPLTLIISQALFVRCGASVFALPLAFVEEIRRVRPEEIEEVGGKLLTRVREEIIDVIRLDVRLAFPLLETVGGYFRMVIVNVSGRRVGIVVEDVLRKDEVVIRSLGEFLRNVKLFPGASIAPDGSLILLLDLHRLAAQELSEHASVAATAATARVFAPGAAAVASGSIPAEAIDEVNEERVVVVADDSISVRKFVARMLEKAGYCVRLASDGLEAAEIVVQSGAHLIVTDLEMPRMNGYELMSHLRQNPETRRIPVMVVTSRAGAKHRDRALKEGAVAFLTKPVQEEQLLAAVGKIIGSEKSGTRRPVTVA
ncbi:MAG TPA: response regulator [Candidatus Acidoferrales bacterium]|nr:response regulator [Candidatus Acidoferrales bacterium]